MSQLYSKIKVVIAAAAPDDEVFYNFIKNKMAEMEDIDNISDKVEFKYLGLSKKYFLYDVQYYKPNIIHFFGYGMKSPSLVFDNGEVISDKQLEQIFNGLSNVSLVFLNGCYSKQQAEIISKYVDYVIGMDNSAAARKFLSYLYLSLCKYSTPTSSDYKESCYYGIEGLKEFYGKHKVSHLINTHGLKIEKPVKKYESIKYYLTSYEPFEIEKHQYEIEKHPYARFPIAMILGDSAPLELIIKSVKPFSNYKGNTPAILHIKDENQKVIPVQVIVECDDGLEIDGKYYDIINVPVEEKDSKPIIFNVKSKKKGIHTLQVRFYQKVTFVGEIHIETVVISSETKKLHNLYNIPKERFLETKIPLGKVIRSPDITIFIHEIRNSSDFEYNVLIYSSDMPMEEMGHIKFQFNPETKFHKIFEDIEKVNGFSTIIERTMKSKGTVLYDELFPLKLKELYWKKRHRIKSVRVISKEPWIPWEIIKPWRKLENGDIEEDEFLCEKYAFSRWLVGKEEIIKKKIKNIKMIVPNDTSLVEALNEGDWLTEFARKRKIKISVDSSYNQVFTTLETDKEIDVLHFSTHGEKDKQNPLSSTIQLEKGMYLKPEDITGTATRFGQSHPIVVLNACQTAYEGFSLTGIQGWATKFLEAGACAFIGTLWSVNDETAFKFIQEFYIQLSSGISLGESVKNARNKCKQQGDTSWLAYQLYGHPNCTIKFKKLNQK